MTQFSAIVAAFIATLQTAPAVSANVYRASSRPIAEDTTEAVNVEFAGSTGELTTIKGAPVHRESRIVVECYARSMSDTGDVAVDALLAKVYARLAADETLSGLVEYIGEPDIEAANDAQGQKTGWVRLIYTVAHTTTNGTLE